MIKYFITNKKHITLFIFIVGILFFASNYLLFILFHGKSGYFIWSDAQGYYQYLPWLIIKNDIAHMDYAIALPSGLSFNKYTCGVAIMEMPFFLLAHLYNKIFGFIDDGYTSVYGMSIWLAAVSYVFAALVMMFRLLRKWFDEWPSIIAVLVVFYGTNLFYYTVISPGYAHAYGFFTLVLFVYGLDRFLKKPTFANSIVTGAAISLAVLIRPTNIFFIFLFLLWDVYKLADLKERLIWIFRKIKYFLLIALIAFIVFIPQMLYWRVVTGHFLTYSYDYSISGSESFIYWNNPKIAYVLMGVESGWLPYAPVFFLFFAGLIWTMIKRTYHSIAIAILFICILYANASWWCYTFSCSFGQRSMIEYYPLFIIPIAFIIQKTLTTRKIILIYTLFFFLLIFTFLNIRMSQFYYGDSCWVRPDWTWVNYNKVLNKAFFLRSQSKSIR